MNAKELFDLCTNFTSDCCSDCPYKDKQAECMVVQDAIHMLRHPSWYVKENRPNTVLIKKSTI